MLSLYSVNDGVWFLDGHPFTPVQSATKGDLTTIHSWVFNGVGQGYGARSEECYAYALYLAELAKAFGPVNRPVWLQEIGAPENVLSAEDTPEFCRRVVTKALDCPNLWGITWWCSHDVPSYLADFPSLEYSLGLFDENGKVKPIGRVYGELAKQYRDARPAEAKSVAIVVDVNGTGNPINRSTLGPGGSVCDLWMKLEIAGKRPTVVTSTVAADDGELRQRGITELHWDTSPHAARFYSAVSDPAFESVD